jgi:hypothetical protein
VKNRILLSVSNVTVMTNLFPFCVPVLAVLCGGVASVGDDSVVCCCGVVVAASRCVGGVAALHAHTVVYCLAGRPCASSFPACGT